MIITKPKRILSMVLVMCMVFSLCMVPASAATHDEDEYNALVARMQVAQLQITLAAALAGEVDFGYGYVMDLKTEFEAFANNIDHDLGVAAAIVDGVYNDSRFAAVNNSNTSRGYNQGNFDKAFPDKHVAAVTYLKQGGIAKQLGSGLLPTYFFSYKSKVNPNYTASAGGAITANPSESNKANIVDLAENYVGAAAPAALELKELTDQLQGYAEDVDTLEEYFLTIPCAKEDCEQGEACDDWTHRLLVDEEDFKAAVVKFKNDIEHDRKIIGDLATGKIDSGLWFADKNGKSYYNNTAGATTVDKISAAISFINNGGYTCGSASLWNWTNQLSYRSNFNTGSSGYSVSIPTISAGNEFEESNLNPIIPMVDATLNILRSGATADNLNMIYDLKVNEINEYINQVENLPEAVPEGGKYTQEEYTIAISSFLANADRDLEIAAFLVSGELDKDKAASWIDTLNLIKSEYNKKSEDERYANAVRFFNEGGYGYGASLFGVGYQLEYKSSFYPDYSSGLFGAALTNKANAINIMRDTAAALALGNKYVSPLELAKDNYAQARARLQGVSDDPSHIVDSLLSNDEELKQFIEDLNVLLGSLDAIVSIIDTINTLGIDPDVLDSVLGAFGLSSDMLDQLAGLRDTLNSLGIDTSGEITLDESIRTAAGPVVSAGISIIIAGTDLTAQLGTIDAYNLATAVLNGTYDGLMDEAGSAINELLGPIKDIVEPLRPYLSMLDSGISLINNTLKLVEEIQVLNDQFTLGNLAGASYTMGDVLDDLADLLEAFEQANLGPMLANILESEALGDIGGSITNALAGMLGDLINDNLGTDLELDGSGLTVVSDTINGLISDGLNNPTKLVPLLRATASILHRTSDLEYGIQDLLDGNYQKALEAFMKEPGSLFGYGADLVNSIIGLFTDPKTETVAMMLDAEGFNDETFVNSLTTQLNDEMVATVALICDPKVSHSDKILKLKECKDLIDNINAFIKHVKETHERIEEIAQWAKANMCSEDTKAFIEKLVQHYAKEMKEAVKEGISKSRLPVIAQKIAGIAAEVKDIANIIKTTGELEIIATEGQDDVFYTFTTNYDQLISKYTSVLEYLGTNLLYQVNYDTELFDIQNGNELIAIGDLDEDAAYDVKVSYKLSFDCKHRNAFITLATKTVSVTVNGSGGEEPGDVTLVGIQIGQLPDKVVYNVGDDLTLEGLVVWSVYSDGTYEVLGQDEYAVSPDVGYEFDESDFGNFKIEVMHSDSDYKTYFDVFVNDPQEEESYIVGIIVEHLPDKIIYEQGETLNKEGLIITAIYSDGTTEPIEEYDLDPEELSNTGSIEIRVIAADNDGHETSFCVTVYPKQEEPEKVTLVSIEVKAPNNTSYTVGNAFNTSGLTVTAKYSDGYEGVVSGYTLTMPDGTQLSNSATLSTAGTFAITVTYTEGAITRTGTFAITVSSNDGPRGSGGGSGGNRLVDIEDQEVALSGLLTLMSAEVDSPDVIPYYDEDGVRYFAAFSLYKDGKIYYLGDITKTYAFIENPKTFNDITGHWAYNDILFDAVREIFDGTEPNVFAPNASMTRAMYATVLARMSSADVSGFTESRFSDVEISQWYGPYVEWAAENEIVTGYDGKFNPNQTITRQEMAAMLNRFITYMDFTLPKAVLNPFADQDEISSWAESAVSDIQGYEIMSGKPGNLFDPMGVSTRAEVSAAIHRFIQVTMETLIEQENTTAKQ